MSDNIIRHIIAFLAMLVTFLAWLSGYMSGDLGWWWTVFGLIVIYIAVHKLVDV